MQSIVTYGGVFYGDKQSLAVCIEKLQADIDLYRNLILFPDPEKLANIICELVVEAVYQS